MTKYKIITVDTWRVIVTGFKTCEGAWKWIQTYDWGQWKDEGGVRVAAYEVTGEG